RGDAAEQSLLPFAGLALGIGLYVAAEVAVSNWLVKLLVAVPVATATEFLSVFWAGLALGRLLSNRLAERIDYYAFTVGCIVLALALLGARAAAGSRRRSAIVAAANAEIRAHSQSPGRPRRGCAPGPCCRGRRAQSRAGPRPGTWWRWR